MMNYRKQMVGRGNQAGVKLLSAALVAILAGASNLAHSQTDSNAKPLTLSEAIRESISHSTQVKQAQSAFLAAKARTGQNASKQLPQVGFTASATQFDDRTTVVFPGATTPFELAPNNQQALTIAITQDLDVSGQVGLMVSQAKLSARSAQYDVQTATANQALATTLAYYAVLRAEQNVKVAQASLDAYRQQQTTTKRLYDGGVGQRIDVYRADSQVAEAESEVVRRQNELNSARSSMNDLIGQPLDQPVSLVAPSEKADALASTTQTKPESQRTELIGRAIERRPEALEATVEVLAAKKGIQIARRVSSPGMSLSLSGTRYPTTSFELPRQDVAALTLTLSVPIFDGGLAREKVNEAKSNEVSVEARQERVRRDIALQVQNAALDVETARKREVAADAGLTAAVAARKLAQQRFESQVGLYIEVTDAQSALTAAQAAKVQATYDLLTAQAQLAHAVNDPLDK